MDSKVSEYQSLVDTIKALTHNESDSIANMANISAVLFNGLHDVNWLGFYLLKEKQLVLGPFQGNPACIRIPIGAGICGKAAETLQIQLVENVHDFAGHIACDAASNSEIVVPMLRNGQLVGVLDADSPLVSRFNEVDAEYLSKIVDILIDTMD
ncbi:MAG: L-methionine (R)-S-oxide reductase [Kangiellaceae bacterium]|jgi:L-methionine (R)-S-oxide reductase